MSVKDPADSGGTVTMPDMQGMDMDAVGAWAQLMDSEIDAMSTTIVEEDDERNEVDGDLDSNEASAFVIQVTNISSNCDKMELYLLFGGEDDIAEFDVNQATGKAIISLKSQAAFDSAILRDNTSISNASIRVFKMDLNRAKPRPINRDDRSGSYRDSRGSKDGHNRYSHGGNDVRSTRDSYSRQSSHYNSQSSLYSNDARGSNGYEYRRGGYNSHDDFRGSSTLPRNSGSRNSNPRYDNYSARGQSRGGYSHGPPRGGRGGYDRPRNSYGGPPQDYHRSDSYSHQYDERPASVQRSRTESQTSEHRRYDMTSRASSRMSINTIDDDHRVPVKKPTNKDIFGEARPVNTENRIREIEEKLEAEKRLKAEKEKVAKEQQQQQNNNHQMQQSSPPGNMYHSYNGGPPQGSYPMLPFDPTKPPPPGHNPYYAPVQCRPTFATPVVEQPNCRYGDVGSVTILKRPEGASTDRQSRDNVSPPLDPVHNQPSPKEATSHSDKKPLSVAISNDSSHTASSNTKKDDKSQITPASTDSQPKGKPQNYSRTFIRTVPKSSTADNINEHSRGGARGGRGGRGSARGGGPYRRSSYSSQAELDKKDGKSENAPEQRPRTDKKDHHGSQASLRNKEGGYNKRGGAHADRGGRGNYNNKNRTQRDRPYEERPHKEPVDHVKPVDQVKEPVQKVEEPKPAAPAPKPAAEPTNTTSVQPSTDVKTPQTAPDTPTTEKAKKKDKKKAKKDTSKVGKSLNGNKFAALALEE